MDKENHNLAARAAGQGSDPAAEATTAAGCGGCSGTGGCGGCTTGGCSGCNAEAEGTCRGCASHGGACNDCALRGKLHAFNYFEDIPGGYADDNMVEVMFKNTRKGFYLNSTNIPLEVGDMVAVEATPGHDIGRVSLTGALVRLQMRKAGIKPDAETRRVFRKAKTSDLERYHQARARENDTMIRARKIAADLKLNMKIGDVEYQGDGNKAIFYYIADERVDFRQLIKVLADTFKIRIEMKQIGARQEAGRIGGIGPCGRPLCCSSWLTNFVSVSTAAARYQDISLNPQKLAGQCAKLKCCLNYEVDVYVEASKKFPPKDARLETADNTYFYFKADIFRREITYSTDKNVPANLVTIPASRAFEVIAMNKAGEKPLQLAEEGTQEKKPSEYADILGQDSLTRFDKKKKKRKSSDRPDRPGRENADRRDKKAPAASDKKAPQGSPEKKESKNSPEKKEPRQAPGKKSAPSAGNAADSPRGQERHQQKQRPRRQRPGKPAGDNAPKPSADNSGKSAGESGPNSSKPNNAAGGGNN